VKGIKLVLVIQDYFTKWVELYPLPSPEVERIANVLVQNFIIRFSPWSWHSDQGPNFESMIIREVSNILGIVKTRTTGYHPQGDGQVERFMRTLQSAVSKFVQENHRDWVQYLPMIQFAYNTSVQESTKFTPDLRISCLAEKL
jgi:transposase InsO family protein